MDSVRLAISLTQSTSANVRSVDDWLNLTELHIPHVRSQHELGVTYQVVSLSSFPASVEDCRQAGVPRHPSAQGVAPLPLISVRYTDGAQAVYRLPIVLADWVSEFMAACAAGAPDPFPCTIEFKAVAGRYIATLKGPR